MNNKLLETIKKLMKEQPKKENNGSYDDHGGYYDEGFYDGYIEAMEAVLKIIETKQETVFKVGDKIKVKSWDQLLNESIGQDKENNILWGHGLTFMWYESKYCNKVYTISGKNIFDEYILINENKEKIKLESFAFELI